MEDLAREELGSYLSPEAMSQLNDPACTIPSNNPTRGIEGNQQKCENHITGQKAIPALDHSFSGRFPHSQVECDCPQTLDDVKPASANAQSNEGLNVNDSTWPSPHSKWYIHTRRYIRKIRGGELEAQEGKEISPHHRPFTPYVERSTRPASHSLHWPKERNINIGTIRHWLHTCTEMHGLKCGDIASSHTDFRNGPFLLIDAIDRCLVSTQDGMRYIALSYVWGAGSASSCTTKATLPLFKQKGGLVENPHTLPKVVHQALDLVRGLGERYLWVDRFCIVQDDILPKLRQLNVMGQVYANAYFTIIAAGNIDAAHGLYGKRRMTFEDRDETPKSWSGSSPPRLLLEQAYGLMQSKWYSRGWTMQEYLLSGRRIIFHNDTVNWECLCSAWNEIHVLGDRSEPKTGGPRIDTLPAMSSLPFENTPWPNMFRYARLVSQYNRRNLTYPEDALHAFAGILTHLSRSFPGGFISGLPTLFFDAALLWQPWAQMTRRIPAKESSSQLPSWSWAGWSGNLNSESWRSAANYMVEADDEVNIDQQCSWKTFNTVQWSHVTSLATETPRQIKLFPEFPYPRLNVDPAELPRGWSMGPDTNPYDCQLYHHTCAPSQPFRYPIPIRDQYKAHIPPITAGYLKCTTRHGRLRLSFPYNTTASSCPAVDILTQEGKWAGVLRLNCTRDNANAYVTKVRREHDGLVELIEISAGEVQNQPIEEKSFDEWNKPDCPRHEGLYEFVNVLWVKYEGSVAYREALGRVKKEMWNDVAKETIPITLG